VSAAKKWPPGYRELDDLVQEHGRDYVRTKLISGQWSAFKLHHNTGDLEPIPATTWCVARGRSWLEMGASGVVELPKPTGFGPPPGPGFWVMNYTVIVRVFEQQAPKKRKAPQGHRIDQAIAKCFPNGTDGISTKTVHQKVAEELKPDEKRGLAIPSETTVKRRLGRRK
jgi:hypothetical protein